MCQAHVTLKAQITIFAKSAVPVRARQLCFRSRFGIRCDPMKTTSKDRKSHFICPRHWDTGSLSTLTTLLKCRAEAKPREGYIEKWGAMHVPKSPSRFVSDQLNYIEFECAIDHR